MDLTTDRTYNSVAAQHAKRYAAARARLGVFDAPAKSSNSGTASASAAAAAPASAPAATAPASAPAANDASAPASDAAARRWFSQPRYSELCLVLWRGYVVVRACGSGLALLGHSSACISRADLGATKARYTALNKRAHGRACTFSRHSARPFVALDYDALEPLYRHECALRDAGAPEASVAAARAYMEARRAPVYSHHALEAELDSGAAAPSALHTIASGVWLSLRADESQLHTGCVAAGDAFYTLVTPPLARCVAIREGAAHGLGASLQQWLFSPLHHLRHHSTLEGSVLLIRFRQWCLVIPRWSAVCSTVTPRQRAVRRLLDMGIDVAGSSRPFAHAQRYVVSDAAECYALMLDARFVELPSSLKALPGVQHAPCRVTADGVKLDTGRGSSLQCGCFYLADPAMLSSHFADTGRGHLATIVSRLLSPAADGGRRLQHAMANVAHAPVLPAAPVDGVAVPRSVAPWVRASYVALWSSMDASSFQWFDLLFDERFLSAVHRHAKDVESRFHAGVYRKLRAGMLVRCRVNSDGRRHGRDPARHYQSWWFVSSIVKARSFYALYQRFGARLLPGRPHHYCGAPVPQVSHSAMRITHAARARIIDVFVAWRHVARGGEARRKNDARVWTASEVDLVFRSIYHKQHPTDATRRASQRSHDGVMALVLLPVPRAFTLPTAAAVNVRTGAATTAAAVHAAASLQHTALQVLQRSARMFMARLCVRARRAAFALYGHFALLQGRSLKVCGAGGPRGAPAIDVVRTRVAALRVHLAVLRLQRFVRAQRVCVPVAVDAPAVCVPPRRKSVCFHADSRRRLGALALSPRVDALLLARDSPLPDAPFSFLVGGNGYRSHLGRMGWLDLAFNNLPVSRWASVQWETPARFVYRAQQRAASAIQLAWQTHRSCMLSAVVCKLVERLEQEEAQSS